MLMKYFAPAFYTAHQILGIELGAFPQWNQILIPKFRGMSVMFEVIFVLRLGLDIHVAGVPIASFQSGLRPPMRPYTKLGVANHSGT
jgi:hypothetical protein